MCHNKSPKYFLLLVYNWIPISYSEDIYFLQFAALIRPSHFCFVNGCVRYADHKISHFMYFFKKCALKLPLILVWPVVTLLIYVCIVSKPFTSSYIIILYIVGSVWYLQKCSINISYLDFAKCALKWSLTLHRHMLSSCLGYVLKATCIFSPSWIISVWI